MNNTVHHLLQSKNRYKNAHRNSDYTIDQNWASYSAEEHDRWDRLYQRCHDILQDRACPEFLSALEQLRLSQAGVPNLERLSDRLEPLTGWRVVPVADLVPDDIFFDHLANRRFPAGAFIRPEEEFDYLEEPDIFHDVFGHVPMLANPAFADFMEAYGKGGQRAKAMGMLPNLARLYWYTVEFGLIKSADSSFNGLKIFGAGILSSVGESQFALDSKSPHRLKFNLSRVMQTKYIIDDYQQTYFVIDCFEQLLNDCYHDFTDIYADLKHQKDIEPDTLMPSDVIINGGTLHYFKNRRKNELSVQ